MLGKLTFLAGAGVGYVLGARAGRERYEQIMSQVRGVKERPEVQDALTTVKSQASDLASTAADTAKEKAGAATDAAKSKVGGSDSGSTGGTGTGSTGAGLGSTTPTATVGVVAPEVDIVVSDPLGSPIADPLTEPDVSPLPGSTGTSGLGSGSAPAPSVPETLPSSSTERPGGSI